MLADPRFVVESKNRPSIQFTVQKTTPLQQLQIFGRHVIVNFTVLGDLADGIPSV